ncbi:reticulocyte-binding protein PFD0110w-like [Teleopsis dalmanni]|uniref:reticulocyte-binding protein PFD0110w-like n=1 Tax=Teleopsis dalmanni TaxID=139649 RepID=UPI0018CC7F73|nr:reticulocyte-binding protein PFD0110w-like [Teleopsis dalmanni]
MCKYLIEISSHRKNRFGQIMMNRSFTENSTTSATTSADSESDNEFFRIKQSAYNHFKTYDADDEDSQSENSDITQFKEYKIEQTSYFYENKNVYVDESLDKIGGKDIHKINYIKSRRKHKNHQKLTIQLYNNHRSHKNNVYRTRNVENAFDHNYRNETELNLRYGHRKDYRQQHRNGSFEQLYRNRTLYKRQILETSYDFPNNNSVLLSLQEINDRKSLRVENSRYRTDCYHEEKPEQSDESRRLHKRKVYKSNSSFDNTNSNETNLEELMEHSRHKIKNKIKKKRQQNHMTKLLFFNQRKNSHIPKDNENIDDYDKLSSKSSEESSENNHLIETDGFCLERFSKNIGPVFKEADKRNFGTRVLQKRVLKSDTLGKQLKNLNNTMLHVESLVQSITVATYDNVHLLNNIATRNNINY